VATAKNFLEMGLDVDKVAQGTGLTKAEVKALQAELNGNKH